MVSETKNKLNKLFISTFIEWIARFSIERFWFIFWQYERPTNWRQFLARRHTYIDIVSYRHISINIKSNLVFSNSSVVSKISRFQDFKILLVNAQTQYKKIKVLWILSHLGMLCSNLEYVFFLNLINMGNYK